MQATLERTGEREHRGSSYLLPVLLGGIVLLFLAAPWSWEHKTHAALHGLCAQIPSHTFRLGDRPLPFDARMTGIYGGFVVTFGYLVAKGRHRAARLPGWIVLGLLGLLVAVMAVDGFNSLFLDLGRPHLYQPNNRLRLVTGIGTGMTLAVVFCFLFGATLWRQPNVRARVVNGRDLALLFPLQLPFALLVLSGWGWLSYPLSLLLVLSALAVVSSLALVAIVLFRRLDYTFGNATELQPTAAIALIAGVAVMALLSGGRFLLEHLLGVSPLT